MLCTLFSHFFNNSQLFHQKTPKFYLEQFACGYVLLGYFMKISIFTPMPMPCIIFESSSVILFC